MRRNKNWILPVLFLFIALHLFAGADHIAKWIESTYRHLMILQVEEIESILDQYDVSRNEFNAALSTIDEQKNREMLWLISQAYRDKGIEMLADIEQPCALVDREGRVLSSNDRLLKDRAKTIVEMYTGHALAVHEEDLHRYYLRFDYATGHYLILREDKATLLEETRGFEMTNLYRRETFLRGLEKIDRVDLIDRTTSKLLYSTTALGRLSGEERSELNNRSEGFVNLVAGSGKRRTAYLSYLADMGNEERLIVSVERETIDREINSVKRVTYTFLGLMTMIAIVFAYFTYRMLRRHIDPMQSKGRQVVRPRRVLIGILLFFALLQVFVSLQLMKTKVSEILEQHLDSTFEHYIEMRNDAGHASSILTQYVVASQREQKLLEMRLYPDRVDPLTLSKPVMQDYLDRVYRDRYDLSRPQAFSTEGRLIILIPENNRVHLIEGTLDVIPELSMHKELDAYFAKNYQMQRFERLEKLREAFPGWLDDQAHTKVYKRSGEEYIMQYRFNQEEGNYYVMGLPVAPYLEGVKRTEMAIAGGLFTGVLILLFWRLVLQLMN